MYLFNIEINADTSDQDLLLNFWASAKEFVHLAVNSPESLGLTYLFDNQSEIRTAFEEETEISVNLVKAELESEWNAHETGLQRVGLTGLSLRAKLRNLNLLTNQWQGLLRSIGESEFLKNITAIPKKFAVC